MRDPNDLDIISRRNLLHYAGAGAAALTLASLINIPTRRGQEDAERCRQLLHQRQGRPAEGHLRHPVPR